MAELIGFVVIYTVVVVLLSATLAGLCKQHESCTPNVEACRFCGCASDVGIYNQKVCLACAEKLNEIVTSERQIWQDRHVPMPWYHQKRTKQGDI